MRIPYTIVLLLCLQLLKAQSHFIIDSTSKASQYEIKMNAAITSYKLKAAIQYADSIQSIAIKEKDTAMLGFAYESKVELYRFLNDYKKALWYLKNRIRLNELSNQTDRHINLYSRLSALHIWQGEQDSAYSALKKADSFYSDTISDKVKCFYYNQKSVYNELVFRLDSAIHYTLKRIDITEPNDYYALSNACNRLSELFVTVLDYDKANAYLEQGLEYIKESDEPLERTKLELLLRQSNVQLLQGNFDIAETLLKEFITLSKDKKRTDLQVQAKITLNRLNFNKAKKPLKSLLINDSLITNKKLSKGTLGQFYLVQLEQVLKLNDNVLAKRNIEKITPLLPEMNALQSREYFHRLSAAYFKNVKQYKESALASEEANVISKKLNDMQKLYLLYGMEARYATEKKEQQLLAQNLKLESQELAIEKQKTEKRVYIILATLFLVSALALAIVYQQRQKRKNQEILTLKREQQVKTLESLMEGEEKERLRIAQELHDGINVDLSSIKYKLTSLLEQNNKVINEAVAMIDKSCEQVRAISHDLVPPSLKNFSLADAIRDFCTTKNNIHQPSIGFDVIGEPLVLSKNAEVNIFRIVQELINNSIKHAEASEINVQLSYANDTMQLTIEDDGKGFDRSKVSSGIGLQNIESRIEYLNGKLDFTSDDKGTSYVIDIDTNKVV